MKTKSVDYLNIGLILLSLWLAIMIPFGLFIYAYAILGPLHYLTEINWLRDKKYYVADRWWIWLVLGLCALLVIPKFLIEPAFIEDLGTLQPAVEWLVHWSNAIIFLLLATALILLNVKKRNLRLILMGVAIVAAYAFNSAPIYITLIGLLVPTLIHVYLFTLLFMIYGAIKSKSIPGGIAALMVALVPVAIALMNIDPTGYHPTEYVQQATIENRFFATNVYFAKFLGLSEKLNYQANEFFNGLLTVKIQVFIAFSYLYHYLNWFSKTTVIGWHKHLTTPKTVTIIAIWVIILGLYWWSYRLGFYVSLFFSFMHVFLEFPLNWLSIQGTFKAIPWPGKASQG